MMVDLKTNQQNGGHGRRRRRRGEQEEPPLEEETTVNDVVDEEGINIQVPMVKKGRRRDGLQGSASTTTQTTVSTLSTLATASVASVSMSSTFFSHGQQQQQEDQERQESTSDQQQQSSEQQQQSEQELEQVQEHEQEQKDEDPQANDESTTTLMNTIDLPLFPPAPPSPDPSPITRISSRKSIQRKSISSNNDSNLSCNNIDPNIACNTTSNNNNSTNTTGTSTTDTNTDNNKKTNVTDNISPRPPGRASRYKERMERKMQAMQRSSPSPPSVSSPSPKQDSARRKSIEATRPTAAVAAARARAAIRKSMPERVMTTVTASLTSTDVDLPPPPPPPSLPPNGVMLSPPPPNQRLIQPQRSRRFQLVSSQPSLGSIDEHRPSSSNLYGDIDDVPDVPVSSIQFSSQQSSNVDAPAGESNVIVNPNLDEEDSLSPSEMHQGRRNSGTILLQDDIDESFDLSRPSVMEGDNQFTPGAFQAQGRGVGTLPVWARRRLSFGLASSQPPLSRILSRRSLFFRRHTSETPIRVEANIVEEDDEVENESGVSHVVYAQDVVVDQTKQRQRHFWFGMIAALVIFLTLAVGLGIIIARIQRNNDNDNDNSAATFVGNVTNITVIISDDTELDDELDEELNGEAPSLLMPKCLEPLENLTVLEHCACFQTAEGLVLTNEEQNYYQINKENILTRIIAGLEENDDEEQQGQDQENDVFALWNNQSSCSLINQALLFSSNLEQFETGPIIIDNTTTKIQHSLSLAAFEQRFVLVFFFLSLGGTSWHRNSGWLANGTTICNWFGIQCSRMERVTHLALFDNGLEGILPSLYIGLFLPHLRTLDLSGNPNLSGRIPTKTSALNDLQLSGCRFNGTIPTELAQLTTLERIYLSNNLLTGTLPSEWSNRLSRLALSHNRLQGTLPPEWQSLVRLQILNVGNNELNGTIPLEYASLTNLQILDLSENPNLNGTLPLFLGQLNSDTFLSGTGLDGTIPESYCPRPTNTTLNSLLVVDCMRVINNCSCCSEFVHCIE